MVTMESVYNDAKLHEAYLSFVHNESLENTKHMRNAESELSMLQRITAQRILDYQVLVDDKEDHGGRNDWRKLHEEMVALEERLGPRLNLLQVIQSQSPNMALAAEFKRASPSKGNIAVDLDAGEQAVRYYTAGACIISVLTEQHWFKGSLSDLTKAREETQRIAKAGEERVMLTTTRPAILRKDFIITTYMILEAAAAGADTVLLIVAVTPANVLRELIQFSRSIGMEPLVEVHTEEELDVALTAGARVIGVNNRNLHTFQLDLATTVRTAEYLRTRGLQYNHNELRTSTSTEIANTSNSCYYSLCALSGMSTAEDVQRYRDIGVGMCLIGESLMRAPDPTAAIASLCLNPSNYQNRVLNNDDDSSSYSAAYTGGTKIIKGNALLFFCSINLLLLLLLCHILTIVSNLGFIYNNFIRFKKINIFIVCGITNIEDALSACQAGASLIGLIFVPNSKRFVAIEAAKSIVDAVRQFGERNDRIHLPNVREHTSSSSGPVVALIQKTRALENICRRPLVVGVFQNAEIDTLLSTIDEVGLDLVQFHGEEGIEVYAKCTVPAIQVMHMDSSTVLDNANSLTKNAVESLLGRDPIAILLDTSVKGIKGGTGITFDWTVAKAIQSVGIPVIVAGGLNPENVEDLIVNIGPWGVDVSSGVEERLGKKDMSKVVAFISNARKAAEHASKMF
jgi:anthranilate synthase/indole-3-glycerol phosphate synthase/phosphoribosylanthranilate isomerase